MAAAEANDECPIFLVNHLEVINAWVSPVSQQQAVLQRRRCREELSLCFLSGAICTELTSSENPLYVAWISIAAGSIVVNRPGNTSRNFFLSANEEPSWITMSFCTRR